MKYTAKDKAKVANYALHHGTSAAVQNFLKEFPGLKRTRVSDWKAALAKVKQQNHSQGIEESVLELEGKQRGRPPILSPELKQSIEMYILEFRRLVGTAIVIAAATSLIQKSDSSSLECNGGSQLLL